MIDKSILPTEMCGREQWICWREENRNGDLTKVPVDPETGNFASSTDDRTWSTLETALEYASTAQADGIGFVFTRTDPLVGIDLDKCRDPETGRPDPEAKEIIQQLESYTEVSPSGTGYHVLVHGDLPDGRNRRGGVEMYDQSRFFTVTADHVDGTPTSINERQDALEAVHEEFVAEDDTDDGIDATTGGRRDDSSQSQTLDLEDEELLEKARSAGNGEKFDRLWRGNTSGYDSQSEADMALCCLLAFWTGGNRMQMDRLFRQSGLIRGKWDDVHHADGSTYGEKTLERSIASTDDFYEPTTPTVETSVDAAAETDTDTASTFEAGIAEPGSVGGDRVYLEEKNDLLEARIDELEQIIADQRDQIEQLTAERQQLRSIVEQQESDLKDTAESPSEKDEESSSLRTRMQRLWRRS
ncbi:phage NrS-1 polymerase family protein [Natrialbaceae archaeon A-gly3]